MGEAELQLLLVDDDAEIRNLVSGYLNAHGLAVAAVRDGDAMWRVLASHHVDLVLLDVMLPGTDGLTLCRGLAEKGLPVILLTALAEESDRVLGLEIGADDYLTKPFSSRELLARVRAVLRRHSKQLPVHRPADTPVYRFAEWTLDARARTLIRPDGQPLLLTGGEFDLLLAFVREPGRVLSRDELLEFTKGRLADAFDRSVDVQTSRLRRKLGDASLIKTVRGGGYLFAAAVSDGREADDGGPPP